MLPMQNCHLCQPASVYFVTTLCLWYVNNDSKIYNPITAAQPAMPCHINNIADATNITYRTSLPRQPKPENFNENIGRLHTIK